MRSCFLWLLLALTSCFSSVAVAQTVPSTSDRLAKLESQVAQAQSSADNSWMLVSSALVLMMTGPGLALFYGGLGRRENGLSSMMRSFLLMAVVPGSWAG